MRINTLIFFSLLCVSLLSLVAMGLIYFYWTENNARSSQVDITSQQLNALSEILSHSQNLEYDLKNLVKLKKFNYSSIEKSQLEIDRNLFLLDSFISLELTSHRGKPEEQTTKLKQINLLHLQKINKNISLLIKKIESAHTHNQEDIKKNLLNYLHANVISEFKEQIQKKLITEKSEIISLNKYPSKNNLYFPLTIIILIMLMSSYIFGLNVVYANRSYKQKQQIRQDELQQIVSQETSKLANANEKLQQINHQQVQFLTDVSHEIRTPLTTICGEAEISLRNPSMSSSDYKDVVNRIKLSADNITTLLDDLIFAARAEKDTIPFDFKLMSVDGILLTLINSYKSIAHQKNIRFDIVWPDEPKEVAIDVTRLKQAINILFDNAIKYSHENTVIKISFLECVNYLHLAITNKGDQIIPEEFPYLFDRFYRGNNIRSNRGSGLGLPIAKWIIEKHNGLIGFNSNPGGEITVTVKIPI